MPRKPASGLDRAMGKIEQLDREHLRSVAEKLCRERGLLDAILRSLREAVIVIDTWGTIEIINPSAEALLGIPKVEEGFPSANLWRAAPDLSRLLKAGPEGRPEIAGSLTRELELSYPASKILRLYAAELDSERFLIVLSDVTAERAGGKRDMEEAQLSALTQLAAGVAHELGNPLNALQIHMQLLSRALKKEKLSAKGKRSAESSLSVAQDEISRLDGIIRNFLQAIRPSKANLQPTDIMQALEETLSTLRPEMEGAKIKVKVSIAGILPPVVADAEQLKQVYFNVLKNAREAMESGGTIHIRAEHDNEWLYLRFTDSGKGIKAESLSHLFEPYHTTKPGGSGLGLMIAQKIMRAHRGRISVESKQDSGTTVTLTFPLHYRRFKTLESPKNTPRLED